jgi:hypothetical protein
MARGLRVLCKRRDLAGDGASLHGSVLGRRRAQGWHLACSASDGERRIEIYATEIAAGGRVWMGPAFNPVETIQSGWGISPDGGGVFERADVSIFFIIAPEQCYLNV